MSENLDLVRSIYADWGHGDFSSVDWAHPEIEYVLVGVLAGESWVGLQGMKEGFLDWVRVWRDWTVTAEDYRELDGERVLVLYRDSGRMKESGPEGTRVENKGASVFHLRDQLVTRIVQYYHRDRAFADLGLTPEEPHDSR
jgi:ketosteroid isomerase-like protein